MELFFRTMILSGAVLAGGHIIIALIFILFGGQYAILGLIYLEAPLAFLLKIIDLSEYYFATPGTGNDLVMAGLGTIVYFIMGLILGAIWFLVKPWFRKE